GPLPPPRRRPDRLRLQPARPGALRLRALLGPARRPQPRAPHLRGVVRGLPDVLARREPPGLLLEPRRRRPARVQRFRRRLGRLNRADSSTIDPPTAPIMRRSPPPLPPGGWGRGGLGG